MAKAALGPAAFLVAFLVLSQGNFVMATSGTEGTDATTTTEAATTTVAATTTAMLATTTAVATTTEAAGTETDATAGTGGETTTQIVRPVIQSIDPVQGADGWQTEITISGVTFSSTGTSATIGGQECLNLTSTSTTISCTTSQNTGKNLVVQVTVNGISSDSVDKTFSFFKGSSPIKFTLSGNIASFVRRDFQIKMQQLLALALADQVYFLSVKAGSVIAEFMLLASPTQPNADTAAVATLKQKAANGELGSVFPGASVEVGGETVSVCESNCGSSDSDEDDGLKGWEIALIVIGVLLGVGLIGAAGFFMYRKNQQNGVGEDLAHRPLTDAPFQKAMAQHATLYKTNEFAMV